MQRSFARSVDPHSRRSQQMSQVHLIDRLLAGQCFPPRPYEALGIGAESFAESLRRKLETAERFEISDVAHYFYDVTDQESWALADFPNLAPVYPLMWMEFGSPKKIAAGPSPVVDELEVPTRIGVLIESIEVEVNVDLLAAWLRRSAQEISQHRWWQEMTVI